MTHHWFADGGPPRVLAHRGLVTAEAVADGIVENSFAAVAAAHAAGASYIESDCRLTRDGVVVLAHDEDLSRVVGDPRRVDELGVAQLEGLFGSRGGLLTLEQALETFPDMRWNLDVKDAAVAAPTGRAVARHADRVLLASFSDARRRAAVRSAQARNPRQSPAASAGRSAIVAMLAAVSTRSARLARRALAGIDALQVPERQGPVRIVTPALIELAHRVGVEVHVWTVDDPADMRRLLAMGADGIVTNRADLAVQVVAEAG